MIKWQNTYVRLALVLGAIASFAVAVRRRAALGVASPPTNVPSRRYVLRDE